MAFYNEYLLSKGRKRSNARGHNFVNWPPRYRNVGRTGRESGIVALRNEETRRFIRRGCAADFLAPDEYED